MSTISGRGAGAVSPVEDCPDASRGGEGGDEILASVSCSAYNHEAFIRDALDGFLAQETDFPFEVVVSDDASTDRTAAVIREYELRFPDKIRAVYFTENQYSQGKSAGTARMAMARGKYIALCEGDDFWTDPRKLSKQVGYMEGHPDCSFCFTNGRRYSASTHAFYDRPMLPGSEYDKAVLGGGDCDLTTREVLPISFIPTASFVYKRRDYLRRPVFRKDAFSGDRYIQLTMTEFGYAHYIDEETCAYRVDNPDSMMSRWARDKAAGIKAAESYALLYEEFDRYTRGRYSDVIEPLLVKQRYALHTLKQDYAALRAPEFRAYISGEGRRQRLAYWLRTNMPALAHRLDDRRWRAR